MKNIKIGIGKGAKSNKIEVYDTTFEEFYTGFIAKSSGNVKEGSKLTSPFFMCTGDWKDLNENENIKGKNELGEHHHISERTYKCLNPDAKYWAIVIDGDEALVEDSIPAMARVHEWLKDLGINHFIYSSYSNAIDHKYKWRLVVECDTDVSRNDLKSACLQFHELMVHSGLDVKYANENHSEIRIWFFEHVAMLDYYESYGYFEGVGYKYDRENGENVHRDNNKEHSKRSGNKNESEEKSEKSEESEDAESLEELKSKMRNWKNATGRHDSIIKYTYGLIKDTSMTRKMIIFQVQMLLEVVKDSDRDSRWQEEWDDIERQVDSGIARLREADGIKVNVDDVEELRDKVCELPWPPGMLGRLCSNAMEMSYHPHRESALASGLGLIAGICGRKFNISNTGLNLYITLVADTGMGKDSIKRFINGTLNGLNCKSLGNSSSFIGLSDCTGPKPLARSVKDARSKICVFEEAGLMMAGQSGSKEELQKFLLSSYTSSGWNDICGGKGYSDDKNDIPFIHSVALSIISESTPDIMHEALLNSGGLKNGHIPRQTILRIMGKKPYRNKKIRTELDADIRTKLEKLISKCAELQAKDKLSVDDVWHFRFEGSMIDDEYNFSCKCTDMETENSDNVKGIMATRASVKAMKYAAIATIMNKNSDVDKENALVIGKEEWEWGKSLAMYEIESIDSFFMGSKINDPMYDLVRGIIGPSILRLLKGFGNDEQTRLDKYELLKGYVPMMKISRDNRRKDKLRYDQKLTQADCVKKIIRYMCDDMGYLERVDNAIHPMTKKKYKCEVFVVTDYFKTLFVD